MKDCAKTHPPPSTRIVTTATKIAFQEGASKVFLFGSSVNNPEDANDLDLGIDGIEDPSIFPELEKKIEEAIEKPVDIVDLNGDSNREFIELITKCYPGIYFYPDGRSESNGCENTPPPPLKRELEVERNRMQNALRMGVTGRDNMERMLTMSQACSALGIKFGLLGVSSSVTTVFSSVDNACKRVLKRHEVPCKSSKHYYIYWSPSSTTSIQTYNLPSLFTSDIWDLVDELRRHKEWHSGISRYVNTFEIDERKISKSLTMATRVVEHFDEVIDQFPWNYNLLR
jgi:predicted nucleotidyltransferase